MDQQRRNKIKETFILVSLIVTLIIPGTKQRLKCFVQATNLHKHARRMRWKDKISELKQSFKDVSSKNEENLRGDIYLEQKKKLDSLK